MIPTLEGSIAVTPDRRVAFSLAGPRDGLPVVYLHGGIGTPIRCAPALGELVTGLGIRHVAISRPGFGASDPCPGRRITDFPADVERVADHLRLERFVLVGVSSGGPYALAAARALGDRVAALGVVSSLSPRSAPHECRAMPLHLRLGLRTVVDRPDLVERVAERLIGVLSRHRQRAARLALAGASAPDRRDLACAPSRDAAMGSFLAAAAGGVRGMLDDYALCCRPWGFDPAEVAAEVHLWHGAADPFVPLAHARVLAAELPRCRTAIGTDDGHFFYRRRMAMVLGTLVAAARRSQDLQIAATPRRKFADPAPLAAGRVAA